MNKMPTGLTSKDCQFSYYFHWREVSYEDPDLDQLQRGPYLDMPSCPVAIGENPDVIGVEKHVCM